MRLNPFSRLIQLTTLLCNNVIYTCVCVCELGLIDVTFRTESTGVLRSRWSPGKTAAAHKAGRFSIDHRRNRRLCYQHSYQSVFTELQFSSGQCVTKRTGRETGDAAQARSTQ